MFVDFGQPLGKMEGALEQVKGWGQTDEFFVGKDAFDFSAKGFVQAVVIIGKKKTAPFEIDAQTSNFLFI